MLKPQVHQPLSIKPLFPLSKPFLHGNFGHAFRPVPSTSSLIKGSPKLRIGSVPRNTIKAIATSTEKSIKVKAVVTVKPTVGGFLSNISLQRGFDDLGDLFGKSLLLELVSAELDPSKYSTIIYIYIFSSHKVPTVTIIQGKKLFSKTFLKNSFLAK